MRQPAIAFTTLLATTLAMTNVVYADEQVDKQAIIKASRAFDAAIERKDVNQAFADRAPEYTLIDRNGKLTNLEQERQKWRQSFQTIRQINLNNEIKQIQINGQTATVISIQYISAIISNPKKTSSSCTLLKCKSISTYLETNSRLVEKLCRRLYAALSANRTEFILNSEFWLLNSSSNHS